MAVARFDMGLTGDHDRKVLRAYVREIDDQTVKLRQPSDHASTVRRPHPTGAAHEQAQFNSDGIYDNWVRIDYDPLSSWVRIESHAAKARDTARYHLGAAPPTTRALH